MLIIADDLGAESTSLYPDIAGDSGQVPIPNIEALAQNGLVFDNAWASPVCSPTRGTIVSGQYGHRTGVTTVGNVLPTSTVTLFDRLTAESPSLRAGLLRQVPRRRWEHRSPSGRRVPARPDDSPARA